MSGGTYATYQGLPLRALTFTRSRGYAASVAEMTMFAADLAAGFDFAAPNPGELAQPVAAPDGGQVAAGRQGAAPIARSLAYEGWLVMSESVGAQEWKHPPVRLFVLRVETVRRSDSGEIEVVKVVAVDARFHWEHGRLRRWSFNRRRADGTIAGDSVNPDGTLVSRQQVAESACAAMFRAPTLGHAPAEWADNAQGHEFPPNAAPVVALAELVRLCDLEEPCLWLDEAVALVRPGEGMLGYAEGGKGPNTKAFPPELLLSKSGSGQGTLLELGYPEDFVTVAGGPRVASVAIDDCEPVVVFDDVVYKLDEKNVRLLTGGAEGLDWLLRFVFMPDEMAGHEKIAEVVLEVFRAQAVRLWRIPGVEVERSADPGSPGQSVVREPGPNAHLMPLLARAETIAGKRLPVTVETYRFAKRHRKLRGAGPQKQQLAAVEELNRLRIEIIRNSKRNPFGGFRATGNTFTGRHQLDPLLGLGVEAQRQMTNAGVGVSDFSAMVDQARMVARIAEDAGSGYASLYDRALMERFAAEDKAAGTTKSSTLYDLAKKFLELEKRANDEGSVFDSTSEAFLALGLDKLFSADVEAAMRKLRLDQEATRERAASGGGAVGEDNGTQTYFVNVGRTVDAGARVYDEDRGIVETSGLAGHLLDLGVSDTDQAEAVISLCPVRVVFGATLRPLTNVPPGKKTPPPRPQTGEDEAPVKDCPGGETFVPEALTDEASHYLRSFMRGSGGATPIEPSAIPAGQELVVHRGDFVELVPLEGEGNRGELDREAEKVAVELFRRRPVVKAARVVVARPWPVQCDGVVAEVTITMRQKNGAPCGFDTSILTGSDAATQRSGATREDPARRGAAALKAQNDAARRERLAP